MEGSIRMRTRFPSGDGVSTNLHDYNNTLGVICRTYLK